MSASRIQRGSRALGRALLALALAVSSAPPLAAQEGDVAPVASPSKSGSGQSGSGESGADDSGSGDSGSGDSGSGDSGKLPTSAMPGGGREATQAPATPIEALSERVLESVVKLYGAGGFTGIPGYGSGVVVDERGFVLTAWSIALDSPDLHVVTARGKRLAATLWSADAGLGIALLKVDPLGATLKPLRLGRSRGLRPGTALLSVGNPFGFVYGAEKLSIMKGVLTATVDPNEGGARMVRLPLGLKQVLLSDIPNNPGSQGGALLTLEGELVGILGRLVESRATNTLVNFAVPADEIRPFLQAGLRQPKARPVAKAAPLVRPKRGGPKLGLRLQRTHLVRSPLPYVEVVQRGSAAERAGIKPDDLVFKIGRRTIRSCRDYDEAVANLEPETEVRITLKRGEACLNLTLEVPAKEDEK